VRLLPNLRRSKITGRPPRRRVGLALVLILGLLAITLAISYATLRGQATTAELARNNGRSLDAKEAAQSGLAAALRKISEANWAGVDQTLAANITVNSWYHVTFTTGDAKLISTDPQYKEYAFRLTLDSIGYAADPVNPAIRTQHHSQCVVQLLRKRLVTEPAAWPSLTNFAVYQYGNRDVHAQFPVQVRDSACILGKLHFCEEYPNAGGSVLNQYLEDLNQRRLAGLPDYRTFPNKMTLAHSNQDGGVEDKLKDKLGITLVDTNASTSSPLAHPGAVLTYRLYPGGKEYKAPVLQNEYGNPLQNVTVAPDAVANPLGIYRSSGSLTVQSNVQITGTINTEGSNSDIQIQGTNVKLQASNLPSLYGSNQVYQLPAALVLDDVRIHSAADAQILGATMVWDEFEIKNGLSTTNFALTGNLITSGLLLRGRTNWVQTPALWSMDKGLFEAQLQSSMDANRPKYFPDFQEQWRGFAVKPTLTFAADSSGVHAHWHDWSQPIYQPDPADPGLVWEVVRWEDGL
jgi:hypothetical protein